MNLHDVIVIGASAGGVEMLSRLAANLPADLPAAVFVVLHVPSHGTSALPAILSRAGKLGATHAVDGEIPQHSHIYIAPPDAHMLLTQDGEGHECIQLVSGPREHGHRPAVDPLFRSAAHTCRERVLGVILTGNLNDGSNGLHTIHQFGGITIVQDPTEAPFPGMPLNAIDKTSVDYILPLAEIAALLIKLAHDSSTAEIGDDMTTVLSSDEKERELIRQEKRAIEEGAAANKPTFFTCPDCGGVLWELVEGGQLIYRCHVGHRYSASSLFDEQANALEQALWAAIRSLEERASLARRMIHRARERRYDSVVKRYEEIAVEAEQSADLIRRIVESRHAMVATEVTGET